MMQSSDVKDSRQTGGRGFDAYCHFICGDSRPEFPRAGGERSNVTLYGNVTLAVSDAIRDIACISGR